MISKGRQHLKTSHKIFMSITRTCLTSPSSLHKGLDEWSGSKCVVVNCCIRISRVTKFNKFSATLSNRRRYSCLNSNNGLRFTAYGMSDSHNYSADQEDVVTKGGAQQERSWSTTKVLEQLKRYGASGILSYGLLNTAYYLTTFLTVWFYFAPAPGKLGYLAAVSRFLKVMAMVWAGSQVTKLFRAAGALALALIVDRGLSWFTDKFKFESRGKAFFTIVGFCFSLAIIMFLIVTLLSA